MLNKAILMGRLVADPELRRTPNNNSVTSFTLAVNRSYVRQGEQPQTDFLDIVAWGKTAEFVSRYFTKGRMAVVTGRLQIRNWTDKDGNKRVFRQGPARCRCRPHPDPNLGGQAGQQAQICGSRR